MQKTRERWLQFIFQNPAIWWRRPVCSASWCSFTLCFSSSPLSHVYNTHFTGKKPILITICVTISSEHIYLLHDIVIQCYDLSSAYDCTQVSSCFPYMACTSGPYTPMGKHDESAPTTLCTIVTRLMSGLASNKLIKGQFFYYNQGAWAPCYNS